MNNKENIIINPKDLNELNKAIDKVIEERNNLGGLSWDFIEFASLLYCRNYKFGNFKKPKEIVLKKSEIVLIALDFFRLIDKDFHKRTMDVVFGKIDRVRFNIYKKSEINNFNEMDEDENFRGFKRYYDKPCNFELNNRIKVNMPIQCGWGYDEKLSKELKKDEGTIDDLYALVHELAHTLDIFIEDNKKEEYDIRNPYSDIFMECTAVGFERALTSYLLAKNIIKNRQDICNTDIGRAIDTLNKCIITFSKLALAKIKEKNGIVTIEDFNNVTNKMLLNQNIRYALLDALIKDGKEDKKMLKSVRYAFSGAIAPIIEDLIIQGETEKIKEYIEASKNERFKDAMEALGITLDKNGMDLVEKGIKRSISELELTKVEER